MRRRISKSLRRRVVPAILRAGRAATGRTPPAPSARRFALAGAECFVGYYDVAPVSPDGGAVLAHAAGLARRPVPGGVPVRLGHFEREDGRFIEAARSELWCWQLGARLHWWPGGRRALGFNAMHRGRPAICIAGGGSAPEPVSDRPLFAVDPAAGIGLGLNFARLAAADPGYGYAALEDPFADQPVAARDGIFLADLASGRSELLYGMEAFADLLEPAEPAAFHSLNAAALGPDAGKFAVLLRRLADPGRPRASRVDAVIGLVDGTELRRVPLTGRPSHYWWLDSARILYTCVSGRGASYVVYDWRDGSIAGFHPAAPRVDGHPSCHGASGRCITDEYPDLYGEQGLHLLEPDGRSQEIGRFPADPRYRDEWRCDLHPRWSAGGEAVIIDSTHEGGRAVYEVPVSPAA